MTVSKRLRFEILKRDNHTCRYCGASAPEVKLHVDHVTPTTLGGTDAADNLVAACVDCNSGKTSVSLGAATVADVAQGAIRWAAAIKQAEHAIAAREAAEASREAKDAEEFEEHWNHWSYGAMDYTFPLPANWESSIAQFRRSGLSIDTLCMCIDIAMKSNATPKEKFKYFCGVSWRRLREAQDIAKENLAGETRTNA